MSFQTPITIRDALQRIDRNEYALPAIQRQFVWTQEQICALFDSLMRGYPIGSFLFWKVEPETSHQFKFYDFVREYHQKDNPHCPPLDIMERRTLTAILDGQQRLTAFNIALRGSMAVKEPRKWWTSPDAFPRKRLHLNLTRTADESEQSLQYDFRFMRLDRSEVTTNGSHWFPIPEILQFDDAGPALHAYLAQFGLADNTYAFQTLYRLFAVVHDRPIISYFLEDDQDLDKVLNIFIRVNSGATQLSYSDLLMSIATAQWTSLDAREAIYGLLDDLNDTREGFSFSKDLVLKAGLMLSDIPSIGFRVTNFNARNMATLEQNWEQIADTLRRTVQLIAGFGFSGQNLPADSPLLPIAYSLHQRGVDDGYLTHASFQHDREAIRGWLIRSILKPGIWGAGLDPNLQAIRAVLQTHGEDRFPVEEVESDMTRRGRSLRFTVEEVEDLAEVAYKDRRCFPLLSLLFPFLDLRNEFHVDHIVPRSKSTTHRFRVAGFENVEAEELRRQTDRLPNLQLLDGRINQEKSSSMPEAWLETQFEEERTRRAYIDRHEIGAPPATLNDFPSFYEARRSRLVDLIRSVLGVQGDVE